MPGIDAIRPSDVRKIVASLGDVSIEEEYLANLRYLQLNEQRNRFPMHTQPNSFSSRRNSHNLMNADSAIQSISVGNEGNSEAQKKPKKELPTYYSEASVSNLRKRYSTESCAPAKRPSVPNKSKPIPNSSSSTFSIYNLPKYAKTAPTNDSCDKHENVLHETDSNISRRASVCAAAAASKTASESKKITRGNTFTNCTINIKSDSKMQSGSEMCFQCEKRVYPLDRLSTGERVYHKACFRCSECNRTLSATNFAKLEGLIFCKPHYIEKFRRRGKYEAVVKPGSSSCSMTPVLKNNSSASASPATISTAESGNPE